MQLAEIENDATVARQKFLEYRAAVREHRRAEDDAMMKAYRAAAQGKRLIHLTNTIAKGGTVDIEAPDRAWARRGHTVIIRVPALAVAHADAARVYTHGVDRDGSCHMRDKPELGHANQRNRWDFEAGTFSMLPEGPITDGNSWGQPRVRAIVPHIPPLLRPSKGLGTYLTLFEAEWGLDPLPPTDPALLKHVTGDIYAVVAVWDLTDLERMVLAG